MSGTDLGKTRRKLSRGAAIAFENITVTRARLFGQTVTFCTDRYNDPIQDHNRGGRFYELE